MEQQIKRIEVIYNEDGTVRDVDFFFMGSKTPWSSNEFMPHSDTRRCLEDIEDIIIRLPGLVERSANE